MLYLKLAAITDQVRMALEEADPDVLTSLAEDHQNAMEELQEAGASSDTQLVKQIQMLSRQVFDVMSEIRQRQLGVSTQIRQLADGKKMVHAYIK
jgi:predicted  nucleic acid-binding Zn-ribbon protein